MKYKEIRKNYQNYSYIDTALVDPYVASISPLFTKLFIKYNIIPNYVTVLMIISGILGAILFSFPSNILKGLGIMFIHLWYILDCSDGEVARITKKFSKFGKEIDHMAHIINHPLYNLSFAYSMICINRFNSVMILFLFMGVISIEMINRYLESFYIIYTLRLGNDVDKSKKDSLKKRICLYIANIFVLYPNFALIFPIIYLIDANLNTNVSIYYLVIQVFVAGVVVLRNFVKRLFIIVNL
ncbi:CDP-alcohol phosphatidyltransferase family protein [Clostridium grantii]|uniref:CDP-alcohol phosphatidyltransferase n=1 Tax=Clostridium grantii DSM 8605 TaxID=1121316 RepID=A0A1M5RKM5_9CLOT|nr:CDP-alcohol phosphatidyltransferase family protein [Clostridium grantii]SHH26740.1 CDP-alcohol phosphatidyltransferase [Clostridium grantii DSM 8605]